MSSARGLPGLGGRRLAGGVLLLLAVGGALLASGTGACDTENTCAVACPTGTRFTNDGTCVCVPFDAGYCGLTGDCPDAYCPASDVPDACGGGQLWSTTICGCYPLADARPGMPATPDAGAHHDADADH